MKAIAIWNSAASLSMIGSVGIVIALVFGVFGAMAGAIGSIASNRASEIVTREANERIAEANARTEEAKAETARVNERIHKLQQPRSLSQDQIERLERLLRSDIFQVPSRKKLRVHAIQDPEAQFFALQLMRIMQKCGVDIYPTDGNYPITCYQSVAETASLLMTVQSEAVTPQMQHLAHFQRLMSDLGFAMKLEIDPAFDADEGVLSVMKKRRE